jgi:hypothetical protein
MHGYVVQAAIALPGPAGMEVHAAGDVVEALPGDPAVERLAAAGLVTPLEGMSDIYMSDIYPSEASSGAGLLFPAADAWRAGR